MDTSKDLDLMHKRLAFSIVHYLSGLAQSRENVPEGFDAEGLEVAVQCIASAFGLDTTSPEQQAQFGVPFDLPDIYNFGLIHLAQTQQVKHFISSHLIISSSLSPFSSQSSSSSSRYRPLLLKPLLQPSPPLPLVR